MSADMQAEELEVLQSIYEGDASFIEVNKTTFQYKFGEEGDIKAFLVEVKWTDKYPDELPNISMDAFYNKQILPAVKEHVVEQVREQADSMLGMCMTFTLFEWVKENMADLMADQMAAPVTVNRVAEEVEQLSVSQEGGGGQRKKEEKKEQLSKHQKRRQWDRVQGGGVGERARGWDWVDLLRHLAQTAPS